ncbi:NADPH-cytochrome P450 reductase [Thraustotheca clavata]|uniref:NADPH--hemoprotein reductase n=1 Tax=Thraustotheca clavata TaxID=74557 RepID=A0A1V9Z822_9STRA|nr:NADPH-cytochrome P450 reductase [Thraustotheca clavata]
MDVIEVLPFVSARAPELSELHRASGFAQAGASTLLKRRRDFHLRRRTNAYNSHKFPARLRFKKGKIVHGERCRKHRRRFSLKEKTNYMFNHRWLVKRMKMEERYGFVVPIHRLDQGIAAALKAPATVADVSYFALIELAGALSDFEETLEMCIDGDIPEDALNGNAEVTLMLYHPSCFPLQAIGPVQFIIHASQETQRQAWMWVHPAIVDEVHHALKEASTPSLQILDSRRELCRFQLRGKRAAQIVQKVVVPHATAEPLFWTSETTGIQHWNVVDTRWNPLKKQHAVVSDISLLSTPANVDKTKVLYPLTGKDITAPMDRAALAAEPSIEELNILFASVMSWAHSKDNQTKYADSFPEQKPRSKSKLQLAHEYDKALEHSPSELLCKESRTKLRQAFVPDHVINKQKTSPAAMPLMLIYQQHGWDVVTLPKYAPTFLKACVFAGASAVGMDEVDVLQTKLGLLSFPRDYPDTRAGTSFWEARDEQLKKQELAKPKAKRTSFSSLQVQSPFKPSWASLFEPGSEYCVLRGQTYMEPFPFFNSEVKEFVPMAMPTLIPIQIQMPRRGRIEPNAMLCLPTEQDITAYMKDSKWSGFMEFTSKQAKKQSMSISRSCIGYVTSCIDTKQTILATGFCHCEALEELYLSSIPNAPLGLLLVRNPSSLQYRPAIFAICQQVDKRMADDLLVYIGSVLVIAVSAVFFLRNTTSEADKAFEARYKAMQEEKRKAALANAANGITLNSSGAAIVKKKVAPGGPVLVLFGSQTGTAQSFARTIADTGNEQGYFEVEAVDMEDFDRLTLKELPYVIFVAATYGEGDPTDNAVDFMKFLRNDDGLIAKGDMANVKFTVFGLGNKQYEQYNAIGRAIDSLMAKHGAQRVYPHGEGDDDSELEEDFDAWRADLWKTLRKSHNEAAGSDDEQETKAKTNPPHIAFECKVVANATPRVFKEEEIQNSNKHFFHNVEVKLVETRELRQSTQAGSTLHLEFDIKNTSLNYVTADNLAILPENDPSLVNRVANALSFKLQECVELSPVDTTKIPKYPFPTPATIEQILSSYVDLNGAPRKGSLAQLAHFATNPVEQEKLLHLAAPEGKDEYNKWVHDEFRTFADVIEAFPSLNIPLTSFIHIVPSLQPRYYTISSSSKVHSNRIHVTLGVIESKMNDGRLFRGVCSNFLSNMELPNSNQEKVKRPNPYGEQGRKQVRQWPTSRVTIRKSTFKLPSDPSTPIIMVGPGTGIAPMRAFLQERESQRVAGQTVGPTVLFFGCRRSTEDYLYADELDAYKANGTLTQLHCAFSRESAQKVYVQHLIAKEGAYLWDMLRQGAHVYVCGATVMGTDVHKAFVNVVQQHGAQSADQAANFVHDMQHNQRYIQELWSS